MKTLFVVIYKDDYCKKLEVIVESYDDFLKWLEIYNKERADDQDLDVDDEDFCYIREHYFSLVPLNIFKID